MKLLIGVSASLISMLSSLAWAQDRLQDRESPIGRYACEVKTMAGIQRDDKGIQYYGKIIPNKTEFNIDIHKALHPENICKDFVKSDSITQSGWFACGARYEAQIDLEKSLRGDFELTFFSAELVGLSGLSLILDNKNKHADFRRVDADLLQPGMYISTGVCEKIF